MSPPTDAALLSEITDIMRDLFDDDALEITPAFSRTDNELWDSMNHLNLVFALESKYKIKFSIVDIEEMQSVGDIMKLVEKKTGKA
uniref:Acyl carrier protein n=1 Tax=uncultured organism TaxID=155900 RepID=A0A7L9QC82_9ZZZZ|nr:acyl carrier protein [uncultured organism]